MDAAYPLARWRARHYWGWLRQLAPEDWEQCVAIGALSLSEMNRQMRALATAMGMRRRYGTLRHDQSTTSDIQRPADTRPSRAARRTGYRKDSERHHAARMKVDPERRREIAQTARAAQLARRKGV